MSRSLREPSERVPQLLKTTLRDWGSRAVAASGRRPACGVGFRYSLLTLPEPRSAAGPARGPGSRPSSIYDINLYRQRTQDILFRRSVEAIIKTSPMRILCIGALVLLASAVPAGAQSAETPGSGEVVLVIVCPTSPCRFRQGEVIRLEINFTAAKAGYGLNVGCKL